MQQALREAALQLIGLNVDNSSISASVLLTDLTSTHFVLYLEAVDINRQAFKLVVKQYSAFNDAIALVDVLKDRPCITGHFGSPPTPESSELDGDVSGYDDGDYANAKFTGDSESDF